MSQKVLQTPELVFRIGWFVPLWSSKDFFPKDLISCIKVCRLWRDMLTPLLWMVHIDYDSEFPEAVAHANRQHIRYLTHNGFDPSIKALQVTQLKGLSLELYYFCRPEVISLLEKNPALISLEVILSSFEESGLVDIAPALLKMTALRCLSLFGNAYMKPDVMRSVLDNNQRLESLTLQIPIDTDTAFGDLRLCLGIKKLCFLLNPTKPTWLFSILQHCPNVEMLTIMGNPDRDMDLQKSNIVSLSKILREYCPKVNQLTLQGYDHRNSSTLSTGDYLILIQATSNLVQLEMSMDDFSTVVCDALLHGSAHSLEVLNLYIHGESTAAESIVSAGKILSSCPKLEHLKLVIREYSECLEKMDKALTVQQPWICSHLKTIVLTPASFQSFSCPASCQFTLDGTCTIEMACEAEIWKQGWKNLNPYYGFPHIPPTLQKHRAALLTAASTLQFVNTIDLGFSRY
ncbi:hypothetical protein BGZ94_007956 [Podila epigama]|nr:hypothetical protein BGZ94_007956 [Podila epigama]